MRAGKALLIRYFEAEDLKKNRPRNKFRVTSIVVVWRRCELSVCDDKLRRLTTCHAEFISASVFKSMKIYLKECFLNDR